MNLHVLHSLYGEPIIAGTGHRPDKLGGFEFNKLQQSLLVRTQEELQRFGAKAVISGMALGFDQILACAALTLHLPLVAAIPFEGQESRWPEKSRALYHKILSKATHKVEVCQPGYEPWKMQARNEWMVNNCDILLACWDGSSGGTGNCVRYATKVFKQTVMIPPQVSDAG